MNNPIELSPVESTSIRAYGYDRDRQVLAVQFHNGHVFHYAGVDVGLYDELLGAESIGRFYASKIKGQLSAEKVTGICPACSAVGVIDEPCSDCGNATYRREEKRFSREDEERARQEELYRLHGDPRD